MDQDIKIAVIGLGYVGLPLAVAFARHFDVIGYDINTQRISELQQGDDTTRELSADEMSACERLSFTANPEELRAANHYIITVPTPVDDNKTPNLAPLIQATELVGDQLVSGDHVIYESTVYPGATEHVCVPLLETQAGLTLNEDFFVGYSPERINPGDKVNTLSSIIKVVSGSNEQAANHYDQLYRRIISAGTHLAPSIKVAEAAKAIENTQRDLNIAFMNELSMMFHEMGIDVLEVIEAAASKWNFLKFTPGLVGGHCIGVDPYYLIHESQQHGYHPQLITTSRRINENMSSYVCERILKLMALHQKHIVNARVLVLGITFKENCPDLRNTRVIEIIEQLQKYNAQVDVCDPWANPEEVHEFTGLTLTDQPQPSHYDLAILCVAHKQFKAQDIRSLLNADGLLFDLKGALPDHLVDERL